MTYSESFNNNNDEIRELLAKLGGKIGEMTLKDFIGFGTSNERLTEVEQGQERINRKLDKLISVLTYAERVEDEIEVIRNQIDGLRDAVNSVELLKGVIELPRPNTGGKEKDYLDFYTVKANGECGMSQSTLAKLAGVDRTTISKLQTRLTKGGVEKAPSYYLQSYTNQGFKGVKIEQAIYTIEGKNIGDLTIYKSDFCTAVITHYAMKGNKTALHYLGNYCAMGMTNWIQGITGYTTNNK